MSSLTGVGLQSLALIGRGCAARVPTLERDREVHGRPIATATRSGTQFWEGALALVHEFDSLPRSGSTAYGSVVGLYPIPITRCYPSLRRPLETPGRVPPGRIGA
jgi:hypothetical protein